MRLALATVAVGAVAAAAGAIAARPAPESDPQRLSPPPPGRVFPLPILERPDVRKPAALHLAPTGSDAGDCTAARPCLSLARAHLLARPGDVVELAGGSYPEQLLPADPMKDGEEADVVFRPAEGAAVALGPVTFGGPRTEDRGASHLTFVDMTIAGFSTQRSRDLSFHGITVDGNFAIQGGADITIAGSRVGGTRDGSHSEIVAYAGPTGVEPPRDVLVDGVTFHDVRMSAPEDHIECLQSTDAVGLTVRNSRFVRCDTFDLRIDRYRTDGPRDVTIENNVFLHTRDRFGGNVYYGLAVRAGSDVLIRHNSSDIAWAGPEPETPISDWTVASNAMPGGRCDERMSFRNNLWDGGERCGDGDVLGSARFADPARADLRLLPGSPAIDAGDPAAAPRFDHRRRPREARPDVGAYEGVLVRR